MASSISSSVRRFLPGVGSSFAPGPVVWSRHESSCSSGTESSCSASCSGFRRHSSTAAIAIRTLEFEPGSYRYRAGAGVVADSVPENEHDEVLAKAGALHRALEIAAHDL